MMRHIFATEAGKPRNKYLTMLGWVAVGFLVIMLIGQVVWLMDSEEVVSRAPLIWVSVLIFFELMAIPFMLGMKVSPWLRVVSMGAGWLVAIAQLVIAGFVGWRYPLFTVVFDVMVGLTTWNRRPKDDLNRKKVRREQEKIFKQTYGLK